MTFRKVNSVEATLKRIWASCIGLVLLSACQPSTGLTNRVANNVLPTLISATTPQTENDVLVLQGRYFGDGFAGENRNSYVILGARANGSGGFRIEPRPENWAPNRIVMGVPDGIGYGYVFVVVDGVRSNGLPINIGRNLPVNPLATEDTAEDVVLELSPSDLTMFAGDTQTFVVAGAENIIWSASEGSIAGSGTQVVYTAPLTPGTYTVSASSSSSRVSARVTVVAPVNLSISPDVVTLAAGEVQTFRALVDGNGADNVTWSAPNGGTIEGSGEQVRFVAPDVVGRYRVTVTSSRDPSRSASATIEVREVQVDISPGSLILPRGLTANFSALVSGAANSNVTWDAPAGGTIAGSGNSVTFTPPNQIGRYTVTATSNVDPSKFATATVSVVEPSVSINPGSVILNLGESQQFTAVVNDSIDSSVRWEAPDGGTISGSGNTVTFMPPNATGNYRVIARSNFDSSKAAAAMVTVRDARGSVSPTAPITSAPATTPPVTSTPAPPTNTTTAPASTTVTTTPSAPSTTSTPVTTSTPETTSTATPASSSLRLQPINVRLVPGQIRAFEAMAPGGITLRWESPDGGDIIGRGRIVSFVAPERPGTYRLVAIDDINPSNRVTATIVVGEAISVRIVPGDLAIGIGAEQEFGAVVTGADDESVLWDAPDGGSLLEGSNNTVTFVSPPDPGQYRLVARSNFDPNRTAEITITVR